MDVSLPSLPSAVPVAVIGAGQAGLAAAYHVRRQGLVPWEDFVVLDANPGPGGAWRHRWDSLTLGAAHDVHPLPGLPLEPSDPNEPASAVVTRYYGQYEQQFGLPVARPVRVNAVTAADAAGPLTVEFEGGTLQADHVISATGTWDSPYWPAYPGAETFGGWQLHTRDFKSAAQFAGLRTVVVGAGASAVQFLLQLEPYAAATTWVTRRPPEWIAGTNNAEWGRAVEQRVNEKTRRGLPAGSVLSNTGLLLNADYQAAIDRGLLVSAGPMERIVPGGIVLADGRHVEADAILWATGFRSHVRHLAPLKLREPGGGIATDGVKVVREPRLTLMGYGASASTLGATRAGRQAARTALAMVGR